MALTGESSDNLPIGERSELIPATGTRRDSANFSVVLVEPQFPGNVGHVARSCLNFDVPRLHLVSPCPLSDEARDRAVHAQRVLNEAVVWEAFDDCARAFDLLVGFTARVSASDRHHNRVPVALHDLAPRLKAARGKVGLVFGREDDGLSNEQIARCDAIVYLPTSDAYPSMNLSHAVTVALYALRTEAPPAEEAYQPADQGEKERLYERFDLLLRAVEFQPHRERATLGAFRRIIGRAGLTKWEYHRLMGVWTEALKRLGALPVRRRPREKKRKGPEGP